MAGEAPVKFRVQGLAELDRNLAAIQGKLEPAVKAELRGAGVLVRDDVRQRAARFGGATVKGIRSRFRGGSVYVEQSLRKSGDLSKRRANFATLLAGTAFEPAMTSKTEAVFLKVQGAVDLALRSERL